jgi:hypothetical protein
MFVWDRSATTKMQDCNGCVVRLYLCGCELRALRFWSLWLESLSLSCEPNAERWNSLKNKRSSCPSPTLMLISRTFSSMIIFLILKDHFRLPHVILDTEFAFLKKQDQKDLSSNSYIGDRGTYRMYRWLRGIRSPKGILFSGRSYDK